MDNKTQTIIEKFKKNPAMAQAVLQSGDGQKLMQMLTAQDGGAAQRGPFRFLFCHLHYLRHRVRGGVQRRERALKSLFFCHCFTPPPKSF